MGTFVGQSHRHHRVAATTSSSSSMTAAASCGCALYRPRIKRRVPSSCSNKLRRERDGTPATSVSHRPRKRVHIHQVHPILCRAWSAQTVDDALLTAIEWRCGASQPNGGWQGAQSAEVQRPSRMGLGGCGGDDGVPAEQITENGHRRQDSV
jgi:hypothetical protein